MMRLVGALILLSPIDPPDSLVKIPAVYRGIEEAAKVGEVWAKHDGVIWDWDAKKNSYQPHHSKTQAVEWWRLQTRLLADSPYTWDLIPFQTAGHTKETCDIYSNQGHAWRSHAEKGLILLAVVEWREAQRERIAAVDANLAAYSELRLSLDTERGFVFRRYSLKALRELLGDEAFYRGVMPQVVPACYYRR